MMVLRTQDPREGHRQDRVVGQWKGNLNPQGQRRPYVGYFEEYNVSRALKLTTWKSKRHGNPKLLSYHTLQHLWPLASPHVP